MGMEYTNAADDNMAEYANVEAIRAKTEFSFLLLIIVFTNVKIQNIISKVN